MWIQIHMIYKNSIQLRILFILPVNINVLYKGFNMSCQIWGFINFGTLFFERMFSSYLKGFVCGDFHEMRDTESSGCISASAFPRLYSKYHFHSLFIVMSISMFYIGVSTCLAKSEASLISKDCPLDECFRHI